MNIRKQKLIDLGAAALADALLDLATQSDATDDFIEQLIASPKEKVQRFKQQLSRIKRSERFIGWREASDFAHRLEMLLEDIPSSVTDAMTGLELVATFYEADEAILGRCDDSNGTIGDLFRINAKELFFKFAAESEDKAKVAESILKLNRKDEYGVRDALFDGVAETLPEPLIRQMIATLQQQAAKERDKYRQSGYLRLIESLARQVKDAKLFEQTRTASWGTLSTAAFIDIARVYLESGEIETASSWLQKIPKNESYQAYEKEKLLLEIYQQQGNSEKVAELRYKQFRAYRSIDSLHRILDVIGADKREAVIAAELVLIEDDAELELSDVEFLLELGNIDEVENYLLERAAQLDGDLYGSLLPLAEAMALENRPLTHHCSIGRYWSLFSSGVIPRPIHTELAISKNWIDWQCLSATG